MKNPSAASLSAGAIALLTGTIVLGISYINTQQALRLGANEPQEWLARDAAVRLKSGELAEDITSGKPITIETMEEPYVVVYDEAGKPLDGNGYLNGMLPTLPGGVTRDAARYGVDRITWEPKPGIREAAVVVPVAGNGGFVLSGRSLKYAEEQERQLTIRTILGWVALAVLVGAGVLLVRYLIRRK